MSSCCCPVWRAAEGLAIHPSPRAWLLTAAQPCRRRCSISQWPAPIRVSAFNIDTPAGTLGAPTTVSGPNDPAGITASPTANLLLVSDFTGDAVDVFSISAGDGSLAPTSVAPLPQSTTTAPFPRPVRSATDPAGKYLYVGDADSAAVDAFAIGADGSLSLVPGSPFAAGDGPSGVAVDPGGRFVYVSNNLDPRGGISAYRIESSTGALTAVPGSPFMTGNASAGPGPLAVHPNGKFLYVALSGNANANHLISVFAIDATSGALGVVAGSPFATGSGPNSMTLGSPTGQFLYTSNIHSDTVSCIHCQLNHRQAHARRRIRLTACLPSAT